MADITSRDFQELIKRQKETTDSLQTIIEQNEKAGTPTERFLDNAAEILNDSRLAAVRERFDKKEGTTEVDERVEEVNQTLKDSQVLSIQQITLQKREQEIADRYDQRFVDVEKAIKSGEVSEKKGVKQRIEIAKAQKKETKDLAQALTESKEDKKDRNKMFANLVKGIKSLPGKFLDFFTAPVGTTIKSIFAIIKNIFTGGLLLTALFLLQKFIDSDMWPKFIEGLKKTIRTTIELTKAFFGYIEELYTLFKEEGFGAVVKKLFTDTSEALGDFKKTFLIGLGIAVAAFGAAIYFAIKTATSMVRGVANMLPGRTGAAGAGKTPKTSVKPGDPVRSKSGKMMVAGEDGKPTTREFKGNKLQKIKKFAGRAGIVGTAITGGLALLDVKDLMKAKEEGDKEAESIAKQSLTSTGGALGGAAVGAAVGSFVPIIGTGIGAIVGGIIGGLGGDMAADKLFKTDTQTNKEISEKNQKLQEEAEARIKKLDLMLEKGTITKEEHIKRANEISKEAAEQIKKNNKELIVETQKNSLKQEKKTNEMIALLEENNKLLAQEKNRTASFMMAGGNTNITTNPTEQNIVVDTKITDSFHSQVLRQQYG
tara:strand:+ start:291 stop:2084 length:1794 start_codon:yes stop_codon:yes gene_type:complete